MSAPSNLGAKVTALVCAVAAVAIGATFMTNASPYLDVAEAKKSASDQIHLAGTIDQKTLKTDMARGQVEFRLVDGSGGAIKVDYSGEALANIGEVQKVVAVGGVKDGVFVSHRLFLKCPSKYEDSKGAAAIYHAPPAGEKPLGSAR